MIYLTAYVKAERKRFCANLPEELFLKDIWELNDDFDKLARWVIYCIEKIPRPKQNFTELAPNIAPSFEWM